MICFLTDGRVMVGPGNRADDFILVRGELRSGPPFRTGLVVPFDARLVRPDGEVGYGRAVLDGPWDPALVAETEFMVVLYGSDPVDVPAGTLISSIGAVPGDTASWRQAVARNDAVLRFTRAGPAEGTAGINAVPAG